MRLINIGNGTYINIDLVVSVYERNDEFHAEINDINRSHYYISKEAYNTILSYEKAKVQHTDIKNSV